MALLLPSSGRYIENHGVIHNMWFNTTNGHKKPYYQTQFVDEWWDNGTVPIWITAQRQVRLLSFPLQPSVLRDQSTGPISPDQQPRITKTSTVR